MRQAAGAALDWFYPRHCYCCGAPLLEPGAHILCPTCLGELRDRRITGPVCTLCGHPLAGERADRELCITCLSERRYFDRARALFFYASPIKQVIISFKFHGNFFLGPRLLREALRRGWFPDGTNKPSAVVPIPLHPVRRRERGYDQALLLGKVVAHHLGCDLWRRALRRIRYTSQQSLLPRHKRLDNVRGAFAVRDPALVEGSDILLVDDVFTSGATSIECAKTLKKAGAGRVQALTLARSAP